MYKEHICESSHCQKSLISDYSRLNKIWEYVVMVQLDKVQLVQRLQNNKDGECCNQKVLESENGPQYN